LDAFMHEDEVLVFTAKSCSSASSLEKVQP
jgi:hypothetical protein